MYKTIKKVISLIMAMAIMFGSMPLSVIAQSDPEASLLSITESPVADSQVGITDHIGSDTVDTEKETVSGIDADSNPKEVIAQFKGSDTHCSLICIRLNDKNFSL